MNNIPKYENRVTEDLSELLYENAPPNLKRYMTLTPWSSVPNIELEMIDARPPMERFESAYARWTDDEGNGWKIHATLPASVWLYASVNAFNSIWWRINNLKADLKNAQRETDEQYEDNVPTNAADTLYPVMSISIDYEAITEAGFDPTDLTHKQMLELVAHMAKGIEVTEIAELTLFLSCLELNIPTLDEEQE